MADRFDQCASAGIRLIEAVLRELCRRSKSWLLSAWFGRLNYMEMNALIFDNAPLIIDRYPRSSELSAARHVALLTADQRNGVVKSVVVEWLANEVDHFMSS